MGDTPVSETVQSWLNEFEAALEGGDSKAAAAMFEENGFWRDLVSLTWNITTMEGRDAIERMLEPCLAQAKPTNWSVEENPTETDGLIESWITFETEVARGRGHLRLRNGRAWTLLTTMVELKGFEEPLDVRRDKGVEHGVHEGRKNWLEKRELECG